MKIAELIKASPPRAHAAKSDYAPVWFPRSSDRYYLLACTDCLRSFSVPSETVPDDEVCEAECIFCGTAVRYLVERSERRKRVDATVVVVPPQIDVLLMFSFHASLVQWYALPRRGLPHYVTSEILAA
jgi:hypothetical protein